MFGKNKIFSSFSTNDLEAAKDFYSNKLGIELVEEFDGGLAFKTNEGGRFMIYIKGEDHEPATYTVLNIEVENVEEAVQKLNGAGIQMEQYPHLGTDEKGISRENGMVMAWFKDPAGNIIAVMKSV